MENQNQGQDRTLTGMRQQVLGGLSSTPTAAEIGGARTRLNAYRHQYQTDLDAGSISTAQFQEFQTECTAWETELRGIQQRAGITEQQLAGVGS